MKKVIFIDRDGVINKDPAGWTEHNYVTRWENFIFLKNSLKALKKLNEAGYDIVLVSNQAGVSKGYYTEEKLKEINRKMIEEIEKNGAKIRKTYYCLHQESDNCNCRKPKTGLFRKAEREMGVKAKGAYFIGDGKMDIEAGERMGMKTVFVLSGKTSLEKMRGSGIKPDYIFDDLNEAVKFVIASSEGRGTKPAGRQGRDEGRNHE